MKLSKNLSNEKASEISQQHYFLIVIELNGTRGFYADPHKTT